MSTTTKTEVSEVSRAQAPYAGESPQTSHPQVGVSKVSKMEEQAIPSLTDRPRFVVFDAMHEVSGESYRAGVWYFDVTGGKGEKEPEPRSQWVCSPLHIDAVTTDASDNSYGRLLRFKNTRGNWRTWSMPMSMLGGDGIDVRKNLLDMGVEIDPSQGKRLLLSQYLLGHAPRRRLTCALQTGWADGHFRAFVLPDTVIGPGAHSVTYQSDSHCHDEYSTSGTLPGWQAGVSSLAVGNSTLTLALCSAFAGPLLALCNAEGGGLHLIGDSSTGKTTAIDAACSVWGGPNIKRSWRTTSNGLEGVAALFNDAFLALDEISECDPKEVGALVYMLGNGRGKQRAARSGLARPVARWRSSVLSTGERSIETTMAEGGYRTKAGQAVRLLDVPAQRTHGAWDELHGHKNGPSFSNAIKREALANHGHAGRQFLEHLASENAPDFTLRLQELEATILSGQTSESGQAQRAARRFALLALAGELATGYGITGWPRGEATRAAQLGFQGWKSLRPSHDGNSEHHQILAAINSFIERHGDSRFSNVDADETAHTPLLRDRAGYWEQKSGSRKYLFTAEGMREALAGVDFKRGLDALQKAGAIPLPGADGKRTNSRRIQGKQTRVYTVDPSALESDQAAF